MYPGAHAKTFPDKPAHVMAGSGEVVTYRQLDEASNRCAQLFRSLGLRRGAAIAFCIENHPHFFEVAWVAQRAGLYYTPISTRLTVGEAAYIISSRNDQGWSTLGDIGYVDAEGYLYLTDRKANMIISGGVNIYPQEAENVLITHPKVADVAVLGVPNEDLGEEVKAVVQPMDMRDAGPQLERELITFCQGQLARFKCPRSIDFEEELPRHPTGKLYKRLLKERYWKGHATTIV